MTAELAISTNHMSKATVILGISSAVVLSIWIKIRRTRRVRRGQLESYSPAYRREPQWLYSFNIDDDTAAEIIKRSRPALELARTLY